MTIRPLFPGHVLFWEAVRPVRAGFIKSFKCPGFCFFKACAQHRPVYLPFTLNGSFGNTLWEAEFKAEPRNVYSLIHKALQTRGEAALSSTLTGWQAGRHSDSAAAHFRASPKRTPRPHARTDCLPGGSWRKVKKMPKRKCNFSDEMRRKYPCFRHARDKWEA